MTIKKDLRSLLSFTYNVITYGVAKNDHIKRL